MISNTIAKKFASITPCSGPTNQRYEDITKTKKRIANIAVCFLWVDVLLHTKQFNFWNRYKRGDKPWRQIPDSDSCMWCGLSSKSFYSEVSCLVGGRWCSCWRSTGYTAIFATTQTTRRLWEIQLSLPSLHSSTKHKMGVLPRAAAAQLVIRCCRWCSPSPPWWTAQAPQSWARSTSSSALE